MNARERVPTSSVDAEALRSNDACKRTGNEELALFPTANQRPCQGDDSARG